MGLLEELENKSETIMIKGRLLEHCRFNPQTVWELRTVILFDWLR